MAMTERESPIWVVAMQPGWYGMTPSTHRYIREGEKFQIRSMKDFSDFDRNEMVKDGKGVEYKRPPGWMRLVKEAREIEKAEDGKGVSPEPAAPPDAPVFSSEPRAPEAKVDEVPAAKPPRSGVRRGRREAPEAQ